MKNVIRPSYDLYINGRWVPSSDGSTFKAINPANGEVLSVCAEATQDDVNAAVRAAQAAFPAWKNVSPRKRQAILLKIADIIDKNADTLALIETLDNGKPIRETKAVDIPAAADHFRYPAHAAPGLYGRLRLCHRRPAGSAAGCDRCQHQEITIDKDLLSSYNKAIAEKKGGFSMKKLLSKKEKARRQSIRRSPQIKQAIRRLDPARILTLDLETTGLTADAEIIQLSIMNGCGDVLMNRYFKPLYTERWDEAMEVNHITPEQVACEDPFILWADTVSSLFMDADLIVGYSTFNDIAKLHASGVVLPDKDIYLDLAEAFSLIHYQETKTITYEKLMNCAAHYGYHGRNWHDSLTDTDATLFCFQHMLDDDQAIFKKRRYPQISG